MSHLLDTNIVILSIYDELYLKATKKFISENKNPLPFSLNYELETKIGELIILFKKIVFDFVKGKNIKKIKELQILKDNFSNVYNVLHHKSKEFSNDKKLVEVLNKSVDSLYSISAWLDQVPRYPDKKEEEKKILKKNNKLLRNLQKQQGLHYADLKIICIANEYAKRGNEKISFVTRDQGISKNKDILEKSFEFILIKKIRDYV